VAHRLDAVNTERLHELARELRNELDDNRIPQLMQQLVQSLQAISAQPGAADQQQQVASARDELSSGLRDAPSNRFSPAEREAVAELGIADLLGNGLRAQIEEVFARNELTPAAAAAQLEPLMSRIAGLDNALNQVVQSFDFFEIGFDELHPGEFEIGFLIPRPAVNDALGGLGTELLRLKRILGPFLEVTTDTREDPKIRSVSSSNFQIILQSHPAAALMIAATVERIISAYEKVMNIRVAYNQLKEADVAPEALAAVESDAEGKMAAEIKVLVEELLEKVDAQEERTNELRKDFEHALNGIANRIDRGYTFEVRAGELPEPSESDDEGEESPEDQELRATVEAVLAKQQILNFTNTTGSSILELPEAEEPTDETSS
jgi:hypothetical protein